MSSMSDQILVCGNTTYRIHYFLMNDEIFLHVIQNEYLIVYKEFFELCNICTCCDCQSDYVYCYSCHKSHTRKIDGTLIK